MAAEDSRSGCEQGLVRICDVAGRPRGAGFAADELGTVITSHEAVDGLDRLVLHAYGERSCVVDSAQVVPLPEAGLALVRTQGLDARPLPVTVRETVGTGAYVTIAARGWRQARVLGNAARVTYTAHGRVQLLPGALELAVGTDGSDALRAGGGAAGGPVVDAETGAVLAVLGTALLPEAHGAGDFADAAVLHRAAGFAVPLRRAAAADPGGPLAEVLARNAASVPAYGDDLNVAGVLQLTAISVGSDGPREEERIVERPAVAAEFTRFLAAGPGDSAPSVLALVGAPGSGRTTELGALARRRARGAEPAPTLWLRGAGLWADDASVADAVARALEDAGRIVAASTEGGRGEAGALGDISVDRVTRLVRDAGSPLLILLDSPEEMPPVLAHRLAEWTTASTSWLRGTGARLVVACRSEYWEQAGRLFPEGELYGARAAAGPGPGSAERSGRAGVAARQLGSAPTGRPGRDGEPVGYGSGPVEAYGTGGPAGAGSGAEPGRAARAGSLGAGGADGRPGPAVPAGRSVFADQSVWVDPAGAAYAGGLGDPARRAKWPGSAYGDPVGERSVAAERAGSAYAGGAPGPVDPQGAAYEGYGGERNGAADRAGSAYAGRVADPSGVTYGGGAGRSADRFGSAGRSGPVSAERVAGWPGAAGSAGPEERAAASGALGRGHAPHASETQAAAGAAPHASGPQAEAGAAHASGPQGEAGAAHAGGGAGWSGAAGSDGPSGGPETRAEPSTEHAPVAPSGAHVSAERLGAQVSAEPSGAHASAEPSTAHAPARRAAGVSGLPPCVPLGPLDAGQAARARRLYGIPEGAVSDVDGAHPLALRLLAEVRAAVGGEPEGRPDRGEILGAYLDLMCLRVAVRVAVPHHVRGTAVRRLAAQVAGRVHDAARRCLGPGQGELDRASFEAVFPWSSGLASAVLAEGLLVPAGGGYRFAHEELADWIQGAHLDIDGALHSLVHRWREGGGRSGGRPLPVPRHRIGPVVQALLLLGRQQGSAQLLGRLVELVEAMDDPGGRTAQGPTDAVPARSTGRRGADATWWAVHLLSEVLLRLPDARPYLGVLRLLAERIARRGTGGELPRDGAEVFAPAFWRSLALPDADRMDLLRRLVVADPEPGAEGSGRRFLDAVGEWLRDEPGTVQPLLTRWFTDERALHAAPDATVARAAQALLHTHRHRSIDELTEALVDCSHRRGDELLAALAEEEPSAVCRAVERWVHDPRTDRRVAAAACALRTAPHVRAEADRALLRYAALALLARPTDCALHGAALALLVRDPQTRDRHLPLALRRFAAGDPQLPASALAVAVGTHPEPVLAAFQERLREPGPVSGDVLRALADVTTPALASRAAELVREFLELRPEAGQAIAEYVDRRLDQGPSARAVLLPLVSELLRSGNAQVRRAVAAALAGPGSRASRPLRAELLDVLLGQEEDPEVLGAARG